jgi:hypothetical protein
MDYCARIICRKHGPFSQSVRQHLKGANGCPACQASKRRLTTDEFIFRAKKCHGNKYDYSRAIYVSARTKILIICRKHGLFKVDPTLHLSGAGGCIGCKTGKLTSEEFIARSKLLFPNRYDYSETVFNLTSDKVRIICPKSGHGVFEQIASNHLAGKEGCASCLHEKRFGYNRSRHEGLSRRSEQAKSQLVKKRLSQKEFMNRAIAIHGERYDLSGAIYRTQYDHVKVRCREHGWFPIAPLNLWKGGGCPICARAERGIARRLTTDEFALRAREIHDNKYKYKNTKYSTARAKVLVTCPLHGDFSVLPNNHLKGAGCPICSKDRHVVLMNEGARYSQKEMIAKFHKVHGNVYNYSRVSYVRGMDPVEIICPEHGVFNQIAFHHLAGKGCPLCGVKARSDANRLSQVEVIQRFAKLHGKRFDYSKFKYREFVSKSLIGCRERGHGFFEMNAQAHLEGKGCPACSQSLGERIIDEWLRESDIMFVREFLIPSTGSRKKGRLRFDFCIPQCQLLIEYDGEQHFRPVRFFGSSEKTARKVFKEIRRRDRIKSTWAVTNSYRLIRIRYDEDIVERLIVLGPSITSKSGRTRKSLE